MSVPTVPRAWGLGEEAFPDLTKLRYAPSVLDTPQGLTPLVFSFVPCATGYGTGNTGLTAVRAPFPGGVAAMSLQAGSAKTAGTVLFQPQGDGVALGPRLYWADGESSVTLDFRTADSSFLEGTELQVYATVSSFSPSQDVEVTLWVTQAVVA